MTVIEWAFIPRGVINSQNRNDWNAYTDTNNILMNIYMALLCTFSCSYIICLISIDYMNYLPIFSRTALLKLEQSHDDVIKWKHFPRNWPFVRGIHRSPVNSPHKGQWRGALMFSLICVWINDWVNNREDGDLRSYRAHYDVIVMVLMQWQWSNLKSYGWNRSLSLHNKTRTWSLILVMHWT